MLKIVALYFCLAIFLVSGTTDGTSAVAPSSGPISKVAPKDTKEQSIVHSAEPTAAPEPAPKSNTTTPPTTTEVITTTTKVTTTTKTTTPTTTTTTTTTTETPTTTPSPTPAPAPQTGEWSVNGTNATCIVVRMAVQFNVSYPTDNKTMWQQLTLPVDNKTVATGVCDTKEQTLNITWHNGTDYLVMHFMKNDTTGKYAIHHIEVSLGTHEFPNIKPNATVNFVHEADTFSTKLSSSYRCMRLQNLELTQKDVNGTSGWLQVSNLQFQAFKTDKTRSFGDAQDCSADVPDVVPIVVGCALTGLVIIVLVAYLVGRRRSQARGYLSM